MLTSEMINITYDISFVFLIQMYKLFDKWKSWQSSKERLICKNTAEMG